MRYNVALMTIVCGCSAALHASENTGCAATVADAVARFAHGETSGGAEGFRVSGVRRDALRGTDWALVERCGRPQTPQVAVALDGRAANATAESVLVHAGESVTVLERSGATRMELQGWAEEAGSARTRVRVRLPRLIESDVPEARIICTVLGKGLVEVME